MFNPEPEEVETLLGGKYEMCKQCPTCIGLVAMSKLYKVCSHASLLQVDKSLSDSEIHQKLEFAKAAFTPEILREMPGQSYYKSDGIMNDHLNLSGKMKTLDYCLRKYQKKRHRVLVFSYSTATLDLIQQHVKTQGWTHLRLDGQVSLCLIAAIDKVRLKHHLDLLRSTLHPSDCYVYSPSVGGSVPEGSGHLCVFDQYESWGVGFKPYCR